MKTNLTVLSLVVLVFAGCRYVAPLSEEHVVPVDAEILGLWEEVSDAAGEKEEKVQMAILKFSDTEYMIHYPVEGDEQYYWRAYPIEVGGVSCVQVQMLGTKNGLAGMDAKRLYQVMAYKVEERMLGMATMNSELVSDDIKTSAELKAAFLKNKDDEDLFEKSDAVIFRRVK